MTNKLETSWPINQKKIIFVDSSLNLSIFATRQEVLTTKKFSTTRHKFLLTIESENKDLKLVDCMNIFRESLNSLYEHVIESYEHKENLWVQYDISMPNLMLKFISTGLYSVSDGTAKQLGDFLTARMDSIAMSGAAELNFDSALKVNIFITDLPNPQGDR